MNIDDLIKQVIEENPKVVEDCKTKPNAISRLIGCGMKICQTINPKELKEKLYEHFGHTFEVKEKKENAETFTYTCWVNKETGEEVRKQFGIVDREGNITRYYSPLSCKELGKYKISDKEFHNKFEETTKTITINTK